MWRLKFQKELRSSNSEWDRERDAWDVLWELRWSARPQPHAPGSGCLHPEAT